MHRDMHRDMNVSRRYERMREREIGAGERESTRERVELCCDSGCFRRPSLGCLGERARECV